MSVIEIFETKRRNTALRVNGFEYRRHRPLTNGNLSWRCLKVSCSATLKTDSEMTKIIERAGSHNHKSQNTVLSDDNANSPVSCNVSLDEDTTTTPLKMSSLELRDEGVITPQNTALSDNNANSPISFDVSLVVDTTDTTSKMPSLGLRDMGVNTPTIRTIRPNDETQSIREVELLQQRDDLIAYSRDLNNKIDQLKAVTQSQSDELNEMIRALQDENRVLSERVALMSTSIEALEADNQTLRNEKIVDANEIDKWRASHDELFIKLTTFSNDRSESSGPKSGRRKDNKSPRMRPKLPDNRCEALDRGDVAAVECESDSLPPNITVHHYADSQGRNVAREFMKKCNLNFTSFVKPEPSFVMLFRIDWRILAVRMCW
ncbi:hypothetical protein LSTR_LSTR015641 [Laodelphax striatellus]|uniref:FLYWCH-type domain-containing protein n=1 Tax=Laodelphax striatellus TaxID=195883 RepID=A0A482WG52_LAOST|nr:hypothetical protein LSTR_LSTR015641 [Laodelphax striatellus]